MRHGGIQCRRHSVRLRLPRQGRERGKVDRPELCRVLVDHRHADGEPVQFGDQGVGVGEAIGRVLGQQLAQDALVTAVIDRQFRQRLGEVGQGGGE
ncbi:hypothetical protein FQZ97_846890 [compost metagenome]